MESPGTLFSASIEGRAPMKLLPPSLPHRCPISKAMNFLQIRRQMVVCGLEHTYPHRCKLTSKVT